MALGSFFPPEVVAASIRRQLSSGTVIKVRQVMDDGLEHEKRFVVVHVEGETTTCVINSNIPNMVQKNARLLKCQVSIAKADHTFMDRDSHIDCSRIRRYATDTVCKQLESDPALILGKITPDLRDSICAALKCSPLIAPADLKTCLASLDAANLTPE